MKLTCELCGSSDLVKQDGMFVCQTCGCKYSLEEARKLMSQDGGAPAETPAVPAAPKNNAQIDNLLNLARSSYESKNYAQAEAFCNQIIALDSENYEAWKLKGEAVNFQINANNQRILEVYNCLMTAYRVLPESERTVRKFEVLQSLKVCMEGEVSFWLEQFEAQRPTDAMLLRAKNAYTDAYNKMKAAFDEMGLGDGKEAYLISFDNFFIGKCNAVCNSAWSSTVGYNYYRDYMNQGIDPFGRSDKRWIIPDTDLYRPMKSTWDTFVSEADNLIELLKYAETRFNDDTNPKVMEAIFSNIAFFHECVIPSGSWKITTGYTSNWAEYTSVGWHEEYSLTDSAKNARRAIVRQYKEKERTVPAKVEARQKAKKEKERKERIEAYWAEHAEQKEMLERELEAIKRQIDELNGRIREIDKKNAAQVDELCRERTRILPCEEEADRQYAVVKDLETQISNCGIFQGKQKKQLQERLNNVERPKYVQLKTAATEKKKAYVDEINEKIMALRGDGKEFRDRIDALQNRIKTINEELTKDR